MKHPLNRERGQMTVEFFGLLLFAALVIAAAVALLPSFTQAYTQAMPPIAVPQVPDWEVDLSDSHAEERHGGEAAIVRECLKQNGALSIWFNPKSGNWIKVCQIDPILWGLRVLTEDMRDEITAFFKHRAKSYKQVVDYLARRGYFQVE